MKEKGEQKEGLVAEEPPIYSGEGPVLLVVRQPMDKIS